MLEPQESEWLRRVRHDLVKRLLWPARDRRELGGRVQAGELVPTLVDHEGTPTTAKALWAHLKNDAAQPSHPAVLAFESALASAVAAAERDDLDGVLALEPAFDGLARELAKERR
jgi:hypothetical protein